MTEEGTMTETTPASPALNELRAHYLVCGHLTRACRQAICDIALDDGDDDPEVRRRAVETLKAVLADWLQAQTWLRREISHRQRHGGRRPGRVKTT